MYAGGVGLQHQSAVLYRSKTLPALNMTTALPCVAATGPGLGCGGSGEVGKQGAETCGGELAGEEWVWHGETKTFQTCNGLSTRKAPVYSIDDSLDEYGWDNAPPLLLQSPSGGSGSFSLSRSCTLEVIKEEDQEEDEEKSDKNNKKMSMNDINTEKLQNCCTENGKLLTGTWPDIMSLPNINVIGDNTILLTDQADDGDDHKQASKCIDTDAKCQPEAERQPSSICEEPLRSDISRQTEKVISERKEEKDSDSVISFQSKDDTNDNNCRNENVENEDIREQRSEYEKSVTLQATIPQPAQVWSRYNNDAELVARIVYERFRPKVTKMKIILKLFPAPYQRLESEKAANPEVEEVVKEPMTPEPPQDVIESVATAEPFAEDEAHESTTICENGINAKKNKKKNKRKKRKKRNLLGSLWDSVCRQFGSMRNQPTV